MGIIKEPLDVDFIVDPRPLTKKEQEMISNYIKADKEKRAKYTAKPRTTKNKRKKATV